MSNTYDTAVKTQVFLKASLSNMTAMKLDDVLIVKAPAGFTFNNGKKTISFEGKYGEWPKVYGKALTEMHKPLLPEVVEPVVAPVVEKPKRKFFWSKR